MAAELATERMSGSDLRKVAELRKRMERRHDKGTIREYFDLNQRAHRFIVERARDNVLSAAHEGLLMRVERARFSALGSRERWAESVEGHRQILNALERRGAIRVGEFVAHHVRHPGSVTNDIISSAGEGRSVAEFRATNPLI